MRARVTQSQRGARYETNLGVPPKGSWNSEFLEGASVLSAIGELTPKVGRALAHNLKCEWYEVTNVRFTDIDIESAKWKPLKWRGRNLLLQREEGRERGREDEEEE